MFIRKDKKFNQKRFRKYFGINPIIGKDGRCFKSSKKIHEELFNEFGSFRSREWKIIKLNKKVIKLWLRAFFDCEGWVFCKTHQNRHIGLDSINEEGLDQIRLALDSLNGLGTEYYVLYINRKSEVQKLIDLNLIPNVFKLQKSD